MARSSKQAPEEDFEEHILDTDVGDEMRSELPGVRLLGHLLARPARRPRRPQARPATTAVHDGRHGAAPRSRSRQERPPRRRGHGPVPPARRQLDLRRARAAGPAVVAAAAAGRRPRQLRLAGRPAGRDALHRDPHARCRRGHDRLDQRGHGRLQAQLRRTRDGAGRAAVLAAQPAGQRRQRHRGRHGHQHRAAQPDRGRAGAAPPDQASRRPISTTSCASSPAPTCPPAARSSGSTASATRTRPATARSACGPRPASRTSRPARRASSSPSCPTTWAPRRSSRRSRSSSRPRSCRASPTSRT